MSDDKIQRTTFRFPDRTLAIIDAQRGDKNRTEFLVDLVDSLPLMADSAESRACAEYDRPCYYGPADNR